MAKLSTERILEMINDLEDYELQWTEFETKFINDTKQRIEDDEENFHFVGRQEATFQQIYDKYLKEYSV